jgi:CRISPR/Cas system-associated endoribonuclease Cas2
MAFKRGLVKFAQIVKKGPLSPKDKQELKKEINDIIDKATRSITIQAIVQPPIGRQPPIDFEEQKPKKGRK